MTLLLLFRPRGPTTAAQTRGEGDAKPMRRYIQRPLKVSYNPYANYVGDEPPRFKKQDVKIDIPQEIKEQRPSTDLLNFYRNILIDELKEDLLKQNEIILDRERALILWRRAIDEELITILALADEL